MPSRRSPSQRTPEGRRGRQMAAMSTGTNAGRMISATRRTLAQVSRPSESATATGWAVEAVIKYGSAVVATNVLPPGIRVPSDSTFDALHVRVGTAPTGAALTVLVKRSGTTVATAVVAAGTTSTDVTGIGTALVTGDVLTFDISTVGSTVPGADVIVQIVTS